MWSGSRSELWELARLSPSHVVSLVVFRICQGRSQLGVNFQEPDECDDLVLGCDRKSGPLFRRGQVCGWERSSFQSHWPWPVEVGLDTVSYESKHSDASVLNFGMSKKANGGFVSLFPKIPTTQTQRIVIFDDWVKVSGEAFKVGLRKGRDV